MVMAITERTPRSEEGLDTNVCFFIFLGLSQADMDIVYSLLFYLCGIFFIGLLVDKEDLNFTSEILPTANSSPFVMAFHALEVKAVSP